MVRTGTRWCAWLGVCLLILCAALNVGDIASRPIVSLNVVGMVDVTQLLVMACAFLCIPYTFAREAHVDVDFVVNHLSARLRAGLMALWNLCGVFFMGMVTWYAGVAAWQAQANGDTSNTIAIPMTWYWGPLLFGCGLSVVVCLLLSVSYLMCACKPAA
ncbi:TRAP transporter small permease [Comamonadaceae bacterium G21597-S1]|nr:TRAP transporter small permease [Comamonadaceae bacterium G21597-S1]